VDVEELDFRRRVKLTILLAVCRVFGATGIHLVLEAIEIYGVQKYLQVWENYKDSPLGNAVKDVLSDEFKHEDAIVSQMTERKIDPEKIRSIFLGFNDGLVEILGAVSGFFAAFRDSSAVLMAALTVAVAGAISMAAGAYVADSSENEVKKIELGKERFLGKQVEDISGGERPFVSALIVGVSYILGATVPVSPVLFGARSALVSVVCGVIMIILVSFVLAFLSGMRIRKRILINLVIITAAVGVTYGIGLIAKNVWGINI
jgi:predicted membrane protein (TIGR00267 family)